MPASVIRMRRYGLMLTGLLCPAIALALIWYIVRPGVLVGVSTAQIAAVVGLLVWPGVTFGLMVADTRAAGRERSRREILGAG